MKVIAPEDGLTEAIEILNIVDHDKNHERSTVILHMTEHFRDANPSKTFNSLFDSSRGATPFRTSQSQIQGTCFDPDTRVDIKKLMSNITLPILSKEIEDEHLRRVCAFINSDYERYVAALSQYTPSNRLQIKQLLHLIASKLPFNGDTFDTRNEDRDLLVGSLKESMNDTRCFAHHFHRFMSFVYD